MYITNEIKVKDIIETEISTRDEDANGYLVTTDTNRTVCYGTITEGGDGIAVWIKTNGDPVLVWDDKDRMCECIGLMADAPDFGHIVGQDRLIDALRQVSQDNGGLDYIDDLTDLVGMIEPPLTELHLENNPKKDPSPDIDGLVEGLTEATYNQMNMAMSLVENPDMFDELSRFVEICDDRRKSRAGCGETEIDEARASQA